MRWRDFIEKNFQVHLENTASRWRKLTWASISKSMLMACEDLKGRRCFVGPNIQCKNCGSFDVEGIEESSLLWCNVRCCNCKTALFRVLGAAETVQEFLDFIDGKTIGPSSQEVRFLYYQWEVEAKGQLSFPLKVETREPEPFFVYFLTDEKDGLLYVGQTMNLGRRLYQHSKSKEFSGIYHVEFSNREESLSFEKKCIEVFNPPLNEDGA